MNQNNQQETNNASLYEEGRQIRNHSTDPGYTMDPQTQGLHGQGQKAANHARARSMRNMANGTLDTPTLVGAGLVAAGIGVLAWSMLTGRSHPFDTESTNGAR